MVDREKVIKALERCATKGCGCDDEEGCPYNKGMDYTCVTELVNDALALLKAQEPITGETSDGYHTFNELYHHRAVLFSVIVANYKDRAWKSVKHHDGTMYDGMFIVGIDTPDGQATYHYDVDPYWDMFKCRVLDNAPEWDGHTPAQAIERIGKLKAQEPKGKAYWIQRAGRGHGWNCSNCGEKISYNEEQKTRQKRVLPVWLVNKYCRGCGREMTYPPAHE